MLKFLNNSLEDIDDVIVDVANSMKLPEVWMANAEGGIIKKTNFIKPSGTQPEGHEFKQVTLNWLSHFYPKISLFLIICHKLVIFKNFSTFIPDLARRSHLRSKF